MKFVLLGLMTLITTSTMARNFEVKEVELINTTHKIRLNLNFSTVRCSALGYGNRELKITVNDLEWISFFDHSNRGESEPCMTAGIMSCQQGFGDILNDLTGNQGFDLPQPEQDILSRFRSLGKVESNLKQVIVERLTLDHDKQTCQRTLIETVETEVDGVSFHHRRHGNLGQYPFDICLKL